MEKRNIKIMLDTNILIDLSKYLESETQYAMETNTRHFCEIKALANLLEEDMDKGRDSELFLTIPERVINELLKGYPKYGGKASRMLQRYGISTTSEMKKDAKLFSSLYNLFRGTNKYYEFEDDLFSEGKYDCEIVVSSIIENMPVLTSNIKHFAGEDNCIQNQIIERLDTFSESPYVKKNFDLKYDKYKAHSISDFLKEYYPDKFDKLEEDVKLMNKKQANR